MKKGKPIIEGSIHSISVEGMGVNGEGVGNVEGFTVFVADALPGDEVEIEITHVKKNYAKGRLKRIIKPSAQRVQPKCPIALKCGGCQIQHLDYDWQLHHKRQRVMDNLIRIGGLEGVAVHPVIGMDWPWRYRNKAQIPIGEGANGVTAGFYEKQSHRIVDIDDCIIQHGITGKVLEIIKEHMKEYGIRPYSEKTGDGIIRHVLVRTGFYSGEVMIVIVATCRYFPGKDELVEKLRCTIKGVMSIVLNINGMRTNVILGRECITLWGQDYITEVIGNLRFRVSPLSFFQVNPVQTPVLYSKVLEYASLKGHETVIDAYCGTGAISLFLARGAKKVYGIEAVEEAIQDAKTNAAINDIDNAYFIAGLAENVMPQLYRDGIRPDVIVLDPPRRGCEQSLIDAIALMKPKRVIYVSCNPATLARDLKHFNEKGYKTVEVQPVDLFPHTVHVECVILMQK